ncbi:hypothetical protein MRX96_040309 [Rhipicephalus microplus]
MTVRFRAVVSLAATLWAVGEVRAAPTLEQCGRPSIDPLLQGEDRILGGNEAAPGSWPWQAGFLLHHNLPLERHFCAGALIDRRHVITASHCVRYFPSVVHPLIRIHLGSHQRETTDPTEEVFAIEHICEHRASYKTYNDIAIIKLEKDVSFSEFIQPVCLPEYSLNDTLPENTELYATGWGKIDREYTTRSGLNLLNGASYLQETEDGDLADVLRQLETRTLSTEECQKRLTVKLLDTLICTEHVVGSTCHGDSGGPLVRRDENGTWFLEGVISGGPRVCGDTKTPMRATRVSRFVRWIEEYRRRDAAGTLEDFCKPKGRQNVCRTIRVRSAISTSIIKAHPLLDVNCCDMRGLRALEVAAQNGDVELSVELLRLRALDADHVQSALLVAIQRGDIRLTQILLDGLLKVKQARVLSRTGRCAESCREQAARHGERLSQSQLRRNAFRALSSPVHILLTSDDPVLTAFTLSRELRELAQSVPEFQNEYEEMAEQCSRFAAAILGACKNTEEVETVLSQPEGFPTNRPFRFPRLSLAILLDQKNIVALDGDAHWKRVRGAHANCQQVLRSLWYKGLPRLAGMVPSSKGRSRRRPSTGHSFLGRRLHLHTREPMRVLKPLRVPLNRFVHSCTSYATFLVLLTISLFYGRRDSPSSCACSGLRFSSASG